MQDSERARALEQAREWQAIAYGDRPETWAALDYYRELGWPVDSNKFPERERVEGRIFAFMSGYREALKAAVDHPPPSGASSQAETVAKLLLAARQVASFARAWEPLSPGDIRDLTKAIEAMDALPAPVSPVEPTGASPFRLTDWIPTAGCDCEKCTAQREAEPPTGASPQAESDLMVEIIDNRYYLADIDSDILRDALAKPRRSAIAGEGTKSMTCPTCHSALGRREIATSICSSPWHDRAVQSPATPQEPSGAQLALADIERAYSETEVALAQVVSRNDKELFFNGDKALRAHLQKNLDYYRIRRDGVRALLASAPPAVWHGRRERW